MKYENKRNNESFMLDALKYKNDKIKELKSKDDIKIKKYIKKVDLKLESFNILLELYNKNILDIDIINSFDNSVEVKDSINKINTLIQNINKQIEIKKAEGRNG